MKEAEKLLPLLLSKDDAVIAAAKSAIQKVDPKGLSQIFQKSGTKSLTSVQLYWIHRYLHDMPSYDSRESDGSPQSELSKQHDLLHGFIRQNARTNLLARDSIDRLRLDNEMAFRFRDQNLSGDWWYIFCSAMYHPQFSGQAEHRTIPLLASALYTKPGAKDEVLKVLRSDNPRLVEGAMFLVCALRHLPQHGLDYSEEVMVDPDIYPAEFIDILDRHPYLHVSVAQCLLIYGSHATKETKSLVKYVLSDDPYVATIMCAVITRLDPTLAETLGITYSHPISFLDPMNHIDPFKLEHRKAIQAYIDSIK